MKRNIISYLMIALLTLAGCGNAAGESGGQTAGGGQPVEKPAAEATLTGTLVQLDGGAGAHRHGGAGALLGLADRRGAAG